MASRLWSASGERRAGWPSRAIASAAAVSWQLVYYYFENRAGLLAAIARHHDADSVARRVAASREMPPAQWLEELLRT